jgi:sugar transferase (PEP-CTERM/EpsH1 system associated)
MKNTDPRPLVLHLVHRFDTGGLENGLANLINHLPEQAYRHAVMALTEVTEFRRRIQRDDTVFVSLHKPPGQGLWQYPAFLRQLGQLQPSVLHTRNLGTLEFQLPAAWAGIKARVHGEHGRDIDDLDGSSRRHRWLRRAYQPFVHHFIALSPDLHEYLLGPIGVSAGKVSQIYNGVDASRFAPTARREAVAGCPFGQPHEWIVGTVGRMQAVKAQTLLAKAFVAALKQAPSLRARLRLVMIGDGPLRAESQAILAAGGVADCAWLPGERSDVPDIMRGLDCFALPSLAEGVSNTILEAMASGLPVVATRVGANALLVRDGVTGRVVPPDDAQAMAAALIESAQDPVAARAMGVAGREVVLGQFSMASMAGSYQAVYDKLLKR